MVNGIKTFDYLLAINRFDGAQLPDPRPGELDLGNQGMPGSVELPDQCPDRVRCCNEFHILRHALQFGIRLSKVREHSGAGLGRTRCPTLQEFACPIPTFAWPLFSRGCDGCDGSRKAPLRAHVPPGCLEGAVQTALDVAGGL